MGNIDDHIELVNKKKENEKLKKNIKKGLKLLQKYEAELVRRQKFKH